VSDGTLYADRPDGTPITYRALGVDPDVLVVSPVAGTGNVTTLAVGGYEGTAGVYTFNGTTFSAPTILTTAPSAKTWGARFSPSGNLLALGTSEGIVRFWNIPLTSTTPTGSPIANASGATITSIVFSPQGTYAAIAYGFQADIWNVSTRALVSSTPSAAVVTYADSLAFSASGGALIVGENNCGRVLVCAD
jgi:WD40 repeat protein